MCMYMRSCKMCHCYLAYGQKLNNQCNTLEFKDGYKAIIYGISVDDYNCIEVLSAAN